jgi:hypothetical protein
VIIARHELRMISPPQRRHVCQARPRPLASSLSEPLYHAGHRQPPSPRPRHTCPATYTEETQ